MQIFVNSVERLNSPVYSAPPCILVSLHVVFALLEHFVLLSTLGLFYWNTLYSK